MSEEALPIHSPEQRLPAADIEPAAYIENLREIMRAENAALNTPVTPPEVVAQMHLEEEKSMALLEERGILSGAARAGAEQWTETGFTSLMRRMVKATARADTNGLGIASFAGMDPEAQDKIRCLALDEYLELCEILSPGDKPAKPAYESSAFFYITPEEATKILDENIDLGKGNVARMLQQGPLRVVRWAQEVRSKTEAAASRFPQIQKTQLILLVMGAPDDYENSIRRYAEKHGIVLDTSGPAEVPPAKDFLASARGLVQDRKYDLGHLNPPPELIERARKLGHEAVKAMDVTELEVDGLNEDDLNDPVLREGYRKKVELLVWLAHRAWRHGDLPVSPDRAPEDFRRKLYAEVLGDFLEIHVALGSGISAISMTDNLVLQMEPGEVRRVLSENSDITMSYLRTLMRRNPGEPDEAIKHFRERVEEVMKADPRLQYYQAAYIAFNKPRQEIQNTPEAASLAPEELLEEVRLYIQRGGTIGKRRSRDAIFEIEERHSEIQEFFRSKGWSFAGHELPEAARGALVGKVEEFIVVNERGYTRKVISTRLRDYSREERLKLYETLAEEYTSIAMILGTKTQKGWDRNPVLNISAEELGNLRAEHMWMRDSSFRRVVMSGNYGIKETLEAAARLRDRLKQWYPGMSDSMAGTLAVERPNTAPEYFMKLQRSKMVSYEARSDSKVEIPDPNKPGEFYRHLRMLGRRGELSMEIFDDEEVERRIADLKANARDWISQDDANTIVEGKELKKLLGHLELYVRGSHVCHLRENAYPSLVNLTEPKQKQFVAMFYKNYRDLSQLVDSDRFLRKELKTHNFAFFHGSAYMRSLWQEYTPYMSRELVTSVALASPRRPYEKLNDLVEYRGNLVRRYPNLGRDQIDQALGAQARKQK